MPPVPQISPQLKSPVTPPGRMPDIDIKAIMCRPVAQGEQVPFMGSSFADVKAALIVAFGITINKKGEEVIKLKMKDGDDHILAAMGAVLKEGGNESSAGREPYGFLADRLKKWGEMEISIHG